MTCPWMRHSLSWLPAAVPWTLRAPGLKQRRKAGSEVFLSAYDDLSPLLEPKLPSWEGPGSEEEKVAGSGRQRLQDRMRRKQASCEGGEDQGEPGSRRDTDEEAEGRPESGVEGREATEEGAEAEGSQKVTDSLKEGCGEERRGDRGHGRGVQRSAGERTGGS